MKKTAILFSAALSVLLSAGVSSCKHPLEDTECVTFSLPAWPPYASAEFPPLAYWEIRCAGGAETGRVIRIEAGEKNVTLEAASARPLAVIAQPVSRHGTTCAAFFKPAGCIYPQEKNLSWESGFAAFVCMCLYSPNGGTANGGELPATGGTTDPANGENTSAKRRVNEEANGAYLATFNWKKLCDAVAERSADTEKPYDPWKTDAEAVCTAIAGHSFGASFLSMKKTALMTIAELEQKAEAIASSQSSTSTEISASQSNVTAETSASQSGRGAESCEHQANTGAGAPHAFFIPQYIPLYRAHCETGKTLVKRVGVTSFLYTLQSIAAVRYGADGSPALAISAVPLYTGEQ